MHVIVCVTKYRRFNCLRGCWEESIQNKTGWALKAHTIATYIDDTNL